MVKIPAHRFKDMIGFKFGRLTVIKKAEHNNRFGIAMWHCKCDCGNESIVRGSDLRYGAVRSCGCAKKGKSGRPAKSYFEWHWIRRKKDWVRFLDKIPESFIDFKPISDIKPINNYPFGVICDKSIGILTYILPDEIKSFHKRLFKESDPE